jgi:iron(III) transport system substrate-binding protein
MIRLTLLVLLLLILIAACSTENENEKENEELRRDEGELIVYTTMTSAQARKYLAAFNAEYPGIRVNLAPLSTPSLTERLEREKEKPVADVVWSFGVPRLLHAQWNDMLFGYKPAGYERLESQFRDTVSPPSWVGIQGAMNVFCVNPKKIEELGSDEPQSWQELLKPAYKGQIAMANPNTTSTGYATITGWLLLYGETKGWQYMDQLHENIAKYTEGASDPCDMVAAGEVAIGMTYDDYALTLKQKGEAINVIFPTDGSTWQLYGVALVKKEEIKPAAKTFLDWSISDSATSQYAQDYGAIPARTDQPFREGFPENVTGQLLQMEFPWASANQHQILAEWNKRYK